MSFFRKFIKKRNEPIAVNEVLSETKVMRFNMSGDMRMMPTDDELDESIRNTNVDELGFCGEEGVSSDEN